MTNTPVTNTTEEYLPATQPELCRWMAENYAGDRRSILAAGGRTSLPSGPGQGPGQGTPPVIVSTTELARVVEYPARDMTVTVEAGIRMDELAALLLEEKQRVPVEAPQAHRATLGGVIAANASGSRRYGYGTIRDYVIGISAVDATGRLFKAGGRVVKNVAGYDLCKMLIGSLGTLAVVTQVTLKLRPIPETSSILWMTFDHFDSIDRALARLQSSAARPISADLLGSHAAAAVAGDAGLDLPCNRPVLCLGIEGTAVETAWQAKTLAAELAPFDPHQTLSVSDRDAARLWFALVEFQIASDDPLSFKANLLPSRTVEFVRMADAAGCSMLAHAGSGIAYGHLPDTVLSVSDARQILAPLERIAQECRGNITILQCDAAWKSELPLFGTPRPAWPLMAQLKRQLDPCKILNPHLAAGWL
jgi:glycolate oxidase FAD binding subunit